MEQHAPVDEDQPEHSGWSFDENADEGKAVDDEEGDDDDFRDVEDDDEDENSDDEDDEDDVEGDDDGGGKGGQEAEEVYKEEVKDRTQYPGYYRGQSAGLSLKEKSAGMYKTVDAKCDTQIKIAGWSYDQPKGTVVAQAHRGFPPQHEFLDHRKIGKVSQLEVPGGQQEAHRLSGLSYCLNCVKCLPWWRGTRSKR